MRPVPKPSITELWERFGGTVQGADRGGWQKATCVLHEDGSPSASINESECRFNCFVCDKRGDAVDLVMEIENVGWARARDICQGLVDGGSGEVRESSGGSGLFPSGSRSVRRGGTYVAPWLRS